MGINSELQNILDIKEQIHSAIKDKNVNIPNDTLFSEYPEKIASIAGASPATLKLVKFNIDPYQITDSVTMHVTDAISVYKNVAVVEKGATITYYASCDQYEDTITQTVTVNTDMAVLISMHKTGVIYGFSIDQTISNPSISVSYIKGCDNEYYTPAFMNFAKNEYDWGDWKDAFFIGKPCMLKSNGEVDYYLDPNDYTKKMDGTDSDVTNINYDGNAMVEFPPIYIKREQVGTTINVYISNVKADEDYEAWNCKREDGTYNEHWYFAAYSGASDSKGIVRSMSGYTPLNKKTFTQELDAARANGSGWDVTWWADEDILRMLFFLMHKNLNGRSVLGYENSSSITVSGNANKLGLCYGYKTSSTYGAKFLGIENYYGLKPRRCNGLLLDRGTQYLVKMTKGQQDGTTTQDFNVNGTGYLQLDIPVPQLNSYIKEQTATPYGLLASVLNASPTTYYCSTWTRVTQLSIGSVGGNSNEANVSSMYFKLSTSSTDNMSSSLSYHAP